MREMHKQTFKIGTANRAGIFAVLCLFIASCNALSWTSINPFSTSAALHSVAFGHSTYMLVGSFPSGRPEILTSRDLNTWLSVTAFIDPEQYHFSPSCSEYHVINAPGIGFLVVGEKGDILVSDYGHTWHVFPNDVQFSFGELANLKSLVVSIDSEGSNKIAFTRNGVRWSTVDLPNPSFIATSITSNGKFIYSVSYRPDEEIVIVGNDPNELQAIKFTSSNGINWTQHILNEARALSSLGVVGIRSILSTRFGTYASFEAFDPSMSSEKFGIILFTADGTWNDFTPYRTNIPFDDIMLVAGDIIYVSVKTGNEIAAIYSFDQGISWSPQTLQGARLRSTHSFLFSLGDRGLIQVSQDGQTWDNVKPGITGDIYSAHHTGEYFAIATSRGVYISKNGIRWSKVSDAKMHEMVYMPDINKFMGVINYSPLTVSTSLDLSNWNSFDVSLGDTVKQYTLRAQNQYKVSALRVDEDSGETYAAIYTSRTLYGPWHQEFREPASDVSGFVFGNGVHVAAIDGKLLTKLNGTWSFNQTYIPWSNSSNVASLRFVESKSLLGMFYAEVDSALYGSIDGDVWIPVNFPNAVQISGMASLDNSRKFVAMGMKGEAYLSADGLDFVSLGMIHPWSRFTHMVEVDTTIFAFSAVPGEHNPVIFAADSSFLAPEEKNMEQRRSALQITNGIA